MTRYRSNPVRSFCDPLKITPSALIHNHTLQHCVIRNELAGTTLVNEVHIPFTRHITPKTKVAFYDKAVGIHK